MRYFRPICRTNGEGGDDMSMRLRNFIGNFGYRMGPTTNGKEISKELNSLFAAAKDTPEYNAIELLSLRTMAKARYDTENQAESTGSTQYSREENNFPRIGNSPNASSANTSCPNTRIKPSPS